MASGPHARRKDGGRSVQDAALPREGFPMQLPDALPVDADETWKSHRLTMWDQRALEYVRERDAQYSYQSQKGIVFELLAGVRGKILDAGCGPAMIESSLLDMGLEVHGIDLSPEMIRFGHARIAQHPLRERCRLDVGEIERLDCPDGHFDAVVAMGVLEYVPDHRATLRELHRVLKPGGTVVLTVPNRVSAYRLVRYGVYRAADFVRGRGLERPEFGRGPGHNRCLPWVLDAELERVGLHKLAHRFCNFILFPLHDVAPALSDRLNRALSWCSASPLGIWGNQYIVKAVKAR
jgi:SAM-dependent methyltransferase